MLQLYNSLTREVEAFTPIDPKQVSMYTCGPTVYNFATIGNFRTYIMADVLVRALQYNGYKVKYIMNITDVGHLTGDNLGDADTGEDRMEKAAAREHKDVWEIASFYTEQFLKDFHKLNLEEPLKFTKATDHIKEQIDLVQKLENRHFTYQTSDGIYFDTSKFPQYGELSDLDEIKEGARVEINPEKRNPRDFALWKFSYPNGLSRKESLKHINEKSMFLGSEATPESRKSDSGQARIIAKRQMEWESPWGLGFPGWHIECSAMSMKYLGETIDIHTGGIDLKSTHHPNEIAQSEAATGKKFVNYWLHGAFILVQGQKMSKSLGNVYRLYDLEKARLAEDDKSRQEKYEPLALRYLYLQTHYRQEMNFTFPALEAAQNALHHLRSELSKLSTASVFLGSEATPESKKTKGNDSGQARMTTNEFDQRFLEAVNNDLNMSEALSVVWDMLKSDIDSKVKVESLLRMDHVLGLDLSHWLEEHKKLSNSYIPPDVKELVEVRNQLRKEKRFDQADQIRNKIKNLGFELQDGRNGIEIRKIEE